MAHEVRVSRSAQVCASSEEWQAFPVQFSNSKHKADRDLHKFLVNDILPDVLPQLEVRSGRTQEHLRG